MTNFCARIALEKQRTGKEPEEMLVHSKDYWPYGIFGTSSPRLVHLLRSASRVDKFEAHIIVKNMCVCKFFLSLKMFILRYR